MSKEGREKTRRQTIIMYTCIIYLPEKFSEQDQLKRLRNYVKSLDQPERRDTEEVGRSIHVRVYVVVTSIQTRTRVVVLAEAGMGIAKIQNSLEEELGIQVSRSAIYQLVKNFKREEHSERPSMVEALKDI